MGGKKLHNIALVWNFFVPSLGGKNDEKVVKNVKKRGFTVKRVLKKSSNGRLKIKRVLKKSSRGRE